MNLLLVTPNTSTAMTQATESHCEETIAAAGIAEQVRLAEPRPDAGSSTRSA